MTTILLVEDDDDLRSELAEALEDSGFGVAEVASVAAFESAYQQVNPDVLILDLSLPDGRGLDIARDTRRSSDIPILFLSGKNDEIDRIVGLELGADDFIQKPCSPRELIARINAVVRRVGKTAAGAGEAAPKAQAPAPEDGADFACFEGFSLNLAAMELAAPGGEDIPLTTAEFQLLKIFVERPQRVLARDVLLDLLRGENWAGYDRTIDGLVSRLRKKLSSDDAPCNFLKTVRGAGYMFTASIK